MFCRYFDGALVTCKSFVRQNLPVGAMLGPIYSGSNLLVNTLGGFLPHPALGQVHKEREPAVIQG